MAETPKLTRTQVLNAADQAANRRLKAKYEKEWNAFKVEEVEKRGEKWAPKPTDEEKAAGELAALLKQYPHLAEQVPAIVSNDSGGTPVDDMPEPEDDLAGEPLGDSGGEYDAAGPNDKVAAS